MRLVTRTALFCILVLSGTASAQTTTIPMPADLKVDPPAADVPANIAGFIGAWARGAWDGVLPHVLVVEIVDSTGRAQVVYALGDFAVANVTRGYRRVTGRIIGDLLTIDLSRDTSVAYRIAGETLRGVYTSPRRRYAVTLTRVMLAEVRAVPASVPGVVAGTTVRIPIAERDSRHTGYARGDALSSFGAGPSRGGCLQPRLHRRWDRRALGDHAPQPSGSVLRRARSRGVGTDAARSRCFRRRPRRIRGNL